MAKETRAQRKTVGRVMHAFAHGALKTPAGAEVKDRKQAIAIGLNEAGASDRQSLAENRRRAARTGKRERKGDTAEARETKAELYAEARKRDVPGRSGMTKAELAKALGR